MMNDESSTLYKNALLAGDRKNIYIGGKGESIVNDFFYKGNGFIKFGPMNFVKANVSSSEIDNQINEC
jgi:hypothetical protein